MRTLRLLPLFCLLSGALAQQIQAPFGHPNIPVSPADRVYAADQTSNTVSVIEPYTNKLLGVIRLGNPVPGALSPLYKDQLSSTQQPMRSRGRFTSGARRMRHFSRRTVANCGSQCEAKPMSR